ncbi:MAG: hypothetical protein HY899_10460 [Deltaproteobacteria bacterium]|nr:hypothetical protein [Deltaproteobacteria bacterium]
MTLKTDRVLETVSSAILGKLELSGSELAALSGVRVEEARRFWQALGFTPVAAGERVFTRKDADVLRFVSHLFAEHEFDPEVLLQMARATGQALARIATMHVASVAGAITDATRSSELSDNETADAIATIAESLVESYGPFLEYIWRRHLLAAISQTVTGAGGSTAEVEGDAVGFADLVDFTSVSQQISEQQLAEMVDRFERIAYQEIPDRGGRVIKMLGDEVMFSNPDARAMAETALALAESCRSDDLLPDARVGVALGPMLAWEGDLYGKTVNLASRLVGIAHPGTVLVSDEFGRRLGSDNGFVLREMHEVKLKGIGKTQTWVLRRRDPDEATKGRNNKHR